MGRSKILDALPLDDIEAFVEHALTVGTTVDEITDECAAILDRFVDFGSLIPGPLGLALETGDGPMVRMILRWVVRDTRRKLVARGVLPAGS